MKWLLVWQCRCYVLASVLTHMVTTGKFVLTFCKMSARVEWNLNLMFNLEPVDLDKQFGWRLERGLYIDQDINYLDSFHGFSELLQENSEWSQKWGHLFLPHPYWVSIHHSLYNLMLYNLKHWQCGHKNWWIWMPNWRMFQCRKFNSMLFTWDRLALMLN